MTRPGRRVAVAESMLTCPHCDAASLARMPGDACVFFHECTTCGAMLQPREGDCCVFCSYGSVPCPPVQLDPGCCGKT